jgi:cell division septation protein DedD
VRDYSEKRGARESIERSVERKPIAKNRPRKESGGMFVLLSLMALICTFSAGVFTGWMVFKGPNRPSPVAAAALAGKKGEPPAPVAAAPKVEVPLSFYKTLPAGGKGAMGTGLNLKKPEPVPAGPLVQHAAPAAQQSDPGAGAAAAPASPPVAASQPQDKAERAERAERSEKSERSERADKSEKSEKNEKSARFVVQVASYREKQEAMVAQSKLAGKGIAAYLVESKLADKGVWYRLRVGRHLSRSEAGDLAGKCGKGSIVLPE